MVMYNKLYIYNLQHINAYTVRLWENAVKTSLDQMEFICVSHITTKAQRNVVGKRAFKAFRV